MINLNVRIERNGEFVFVGRITGTDSSDSRFNYSEEYLKRKDASMISLSLPLQKEPFTPSRTRNFFEGLLPEGFTRHTVAQWLHADEEDYLSILHGLGRECLGALCITERDEHTQASYQRITEKEIRELAAEGAAKSAELITSSHLSLAGASGKAGLYYDDETNTWYLPRGTAPSTHIVKQSHVRLDSIVTNEQLSLLAASKCGIDTAKSFIINTAQGKDQEILLASKRFDRCIVPGGRQINRLPCPLRLHQEDFSQAMGIPSAEKYEKKPSGYLRRMFDVLRKYSADPVTDQLKLWDMLVFNYLIGNTDSHIKNFSLLYSPSLKGIRLAPAYDIISTTIYEQSTRDMSFFFGDVLSIDDISREVFRLTAKGAGLGDRLAMKRLDELFEKFRPALHQAALELTEAGFHKALDLEQRILDTGGVRNVTL